MVSFILFVDRECDKRVINAEEVRVGDMLLVKRHQHVRESNVTSINTRQDLGAFAPLTESGSLLVNNVLVSCYAHTPVHPTLVHAVFAPLRIATSLYSSAASFLSSLS